MRSPSPSPTQGLCDLTDPEVRASYYARLPVAEVWGIGGRIVDKLQRLGIVTVADFVTMGARLVRDLLTVVGARVQAELRGVSCIPPALAATRKGIAVTRSFGHPVTTWQEMREAVAAHATRAGEKLRAEGLQACHMAVFLQTNPHRPTRRGTPGSIIMRPAGVVVSIFSVSERKPAPASAILSMMCSTSLSERDRRSSFQTTTVSPLAKLVQHAVQLRPIPAPDVASSNSRWHPAIRSASACKALFCSPPLDTRA